MGHSKTTLTFINDNNVLYTRIINIGGLYFNQVLKNRFDISIGEAESLKCFVSSILINDDEFNNNKENMVAQVLNEAVTELGLEILRTIQAFVAKENLNITSIFLTGGSSKIAGIDSVFQELLGISVSFLLIQEDKILFDLNDENIKNSDEIAKNLKVFSQSIAISMRGLPLIKEISKINFRKGEFAQISNYDKLIKQIFLYSSIVAIVLFSLMLSYFFRYFMYNKEINDLKTNFRRDIISLFSGEPASLRMISGKKDWDFINYGKESLILLQQNMSDKKLFLEQFSSSETPLPLKIMNQVSQSIPSTMYFEVSEFRVQDNQFYIEAETNDPENIKKIINILSKINLISNVTKKSQSVKVGTDKKITHFSLVANVVER
ncbi:pilus assembly protein PilM [Spirobacillus cienkowskii]|uniref:pilus assembly protein PilM n=1 Tax=Spirobacillus cienkowskii TaxID=495820 RepID=UPI0030D2F735